MVLRAFNPLRRFLVGRRSARAEQRAADQRATDRRAEEVPMTFRHAEIRRTIILVCSDLQDNASFKRQHVAEWHDGRTLKELGLQLQMNHNDSTVWDYDFALLIADIMSQIQAATGDVILLIEESSLESVCSALQKRPPPSQKLRVIALGNTLELEKHNWGWATPRELIGRRSLWELARMEL